MVPFVYYEDNAPWVDTGHAEVGPFNCALDASEHVLRCMTMAAKMQFPKPLFLEASS